MTGPTFFGAFQTYPSQNSGPMFSQQPSNNFKPVYRQEHFRTVPLTPQS